MKKHTRHLLLLLSLLPWGLLHGQGGYPVNCQAVLSPGGTLSWSGLTSPGGGLRVRLRLRDGGEAQVRAYLRFSLERVGLVIRSRPGYVGTVPVDLPFGVPVEVGGEALSEMFRPGNVEVSSAGGALDAATLYRGGRLPFGLYTLRVTAYEHGGARGHRQLSNEGLALMAVFQGHPPVLNHPVGDRVLPAREPANILFQWTPRGTASRGGGAGAYEMELYAVPEGMHAAWAVGNSSPIFTGVSDRPSLAYGQGFGHPQLEPGRRYAWRVRVRGLSGPDSYGNGGYSNVGSFRYGPPCSPPENLEAEPRGDWGYTLTWDPSPAALSYRLRYRPEGSGGWGGGAASLEPYLGFSRPLVGQRYEFEVAAVCSGVQTSGWAGTPRVEKAGEGEPPPPGAGRPLTEGPGLSRLLDPWGILASSSGQGEGSQAYKELEAGLAVLPNGPRCGGPVDNTLDCEPAGGHPGTGPPFTFAPGREMFINGYKVTVVGGDASAGRGLLHYPWLGRSLPVEWKGITAVRGEEGQGHGCVTAGQLEVTGGQDGGLASDYRRAVQDLLTSGTGEYSGTLREAAGLVSAQGDSLAVGENINWALSGKAMSALGGGLGEWRGKVEGHFSQGGGTPPPEVRAVLDSLSAMQGKLNALAACVVRNIPASAGGELAPLRLEKSLFACQLGGADIAFMQGLEGMVGELVEKLGSLSCNCSEVASHCDEVAEIMDGIRAANGQEGKIYEMHIPSFGLEEYENGGSPFLVGVDRQGHCYQLRVSPLFAGGRALLDLASYTVEGNTVSIKTAGGQAGAAIALLPSSRATMEDLLAELGFEEEEEEDKEEEISDSDYINIANQLGVDKCVIKAIVSVEVGGKTGFLSDGKPKIRYEGHYMYKFLLKDVNFKDKVTVLRKEGFGDVIYPYSETKKYPHGWPQLLKARSVHEGYANQSSSWGVGQIMGANYLACSFEAIEGFVNAQNTLKGQIKSFVNFCGGNVDLVSAMKNKDFTQFAKIYNGPSYSDYNYDIKMKNAYEKCN